MFTVRADYTSVRAFFAQKKSVAEATLKYVQLFFNTGCVKKLAVQFVVKLVEGFAESLENKQVNADAYDSGDDCADDNI